MKISHLLALTTICGSFALSGCAGKKDLTSAELAPTSAKTATTAAAPSQAQQAAEKPAPSTAIAGTTIASDDLARSAGSVQPDSAKGNLDTVYFDFDAYLLSAATRETLTRNASLLGENKLTRIIIEGHADERGSDEYNLSLAEKRATAARRYLESLGIDPARMEIISYGEDKPAVAGDDEAAWSKNRRVDFVGAK